MRAPPQTKGGAVRSNDAAINMLVGLFFASVSLLFLLVLNKIGIDIPTASYQAESTAVLPDFFPNLICWCVFFFSLGLMVSNIKAFRSPPGKVACASAIDDSKMEGGFLVRAAAMGTLIVLYYVADFLGIVIAGFVFYLLFALFTGERKPVRAVVGAVLASLVLYYFFVKVASVPLPLGLLSDVL